MDIRETDTQDSEEDLIRKHGYPPFYDDWRMYMPTEIDYEAKSDHDLLVMAVMQGNDTVKQQEKIIKHLEELNGTVGSDHTWLIPIKWAVGVLLIYAVTGRVTGWW